MDGAKRRAVFALWSVWGLGARAFDQIERWVEGRWTEVLERPIAQWLPEAKVQLSPSARARLLALQFLAPAADAVESRLRETRTLASLRGSPGYPEVLSPLEGAPPVLFHLGTPGPRRPRLAMVGTRHPDGGFRPFAEKLAREMAQGGVGVVSGAAEGIDTFCHQGALSVGGETWAFLGSALDTMGPSQRGLLPQILDAGGVVYSELPPGTRADKTTFPRRNRLISGASDAILVLQAPLGSGALYTARYGKSQGRPVLAIPGDVHNQTSAGSNQLLREGAQICLSAADLWSVLGIRLPGKGRGDTALFDLFGSALLTSDTRKAYEALAQVPLSFEVILAKSRLPSAALTSALCELELMGRVLQHPGKRYERV